MRSSSLLKTVVSAPDVLELDIKDLDDWKNDDVIEWIGQLGFGAPEKQALTEFLITGQYTGKTLASINMKTFRQHKSEDLTRMVVGKFLIARNHLVKKGRFHSEWGVVFSKFARNFTAENLNSKENIQQCKHSIEKFVNKKIFYSYYFSYFVEYQTYLKNVKELQDATGDDKKVLVKRCTEMKASINKKYKKLTNRKFFSGEKIDEFNADPTKILSNFGFKKIEGKWKIPVRIVITEILGEFEEVKKTVRRLLSPFVKLGTSTSATKFGLFHTACIIGPWYLEWNMGELVAPKKSFFSEMALVAHDVTCQAEFDFLNIGPISRKIVETLHTWNTVYRYSNLTLGKGGNCQDFVENVFSNLGVDCQKLLKKDPFFHSFIEKLRKSGKGNLEYVPSKAVRKKMKLKWKKRVFRTHSELDLFVIDLFKEWPDFQAEHESECGLLKSFDRAMWLKHYRFPDKAIYKPLIDHSVESEEEYLSDSDDFMDDILNEKEKEATCKCPFKDPRTLNVSFKQNT